MDGGAGAPSPLTWQSSRPAAAGVSARPRNAKTRAGKAGEPADTGAPVDAALSLQPRDPEAPVTA